MCEKERIFKNWLKERIGEIIEKMEMRECLRLLKSEKHIILPIECSFGELLKEASWEEVKAIGECVTHEERIFEFFLESLPIEQRMRYLEEEESDIGLYGDMHSKRVGAIALREYLESLLSRQVNFGKKSYFINIPGGPASKGETIKREVTTLLIDEEKEIPIDFAIIATDDLLTEKEKGNYKDYGVGLRIIKGVQRHHEGISWEEFLYGVELCFIPRAPDLNGYLFKGILIRRPFPYNWVEVDLYDEEVEAVIELLQKGGISIEWPSVAEETLKILEVYCSPGPHVDWSKIQEINEKERKRKGYYEKKKN